MENIKVSVRNFLSKYINKNHDLQDDDDIFALGFVNSLFAMQLVMFIEKEFNIAVENEDLALTNFRSINAVAELVNSKIK